MLVRFAALVLIFASGLTIATAESQSVEQMIKNGGAYAETMDGRLLFSYRGSEGFIPASTMKLLTAAAALEILGKDYRYVTKVYRQGSEIFIQGRGDPFVTSEELALMAKEISLLAPFSAIVLDDSYVPSVSIDGSSNTSNPYDAANGSLIANFGTVYLTRLANGKVVSAEPQTPLTAISQRAGKGLSVGTHRVNLGADRRLAVQYTGELLVSFLEREGIASVVSRTGSTPSDAKVVLEHRSSRSLLEVVAAMLEFSTNFIANQVMLTLGAARFGERPSVAKGTRAIQDFARNELHLESAIVYDGAGLSRRNRISPKDLVSIVRELDRYPGILPIKGEFEGKTGTLTGVSTFAGYAREGSRRGFRFAIEVNDDVGFDYKFKVAEALRRKLAALSVR